MKKKPQRRRKPDRHVRIVAAAAIVVVQLLLLFAGWIASQYAMEPTRVFVRDLRAAFDAPETRPAVMTIPPAIPQPAPAAEADPVVLHFDALPSFTPSPEPAPASMSRRSYLALIQDEASRHDVPADLVEAIVLVESGFDPRALSPKGARGLMQVMPATAARFGVSNPDHLYQPARNLSAGTAYLAWLLRRYRGDLDRTLAAYNAGEGAVESYGGIPPYRETREYVRRVRVALSRMGA